MTPERGAPAIELEHVTKRYGTAVALDDVSLRIDAGEFFCLLGPSGCGKTTTLNLIGGFLPVTEGELRIEGRRVNDLPPHQRNVNTVFQNYALFPHMTVADNVSFGLRMQGLEPDAIQQRVAEYLELVDLVGFGNRYPTQLSGGQAQRIALARALAKRPAVLLLDEPLGALDLKLRKQMQVELSRIHRQVGTTFVFVTHDQEEALSMATRIAVMSGGRIRQIGSPREIYLRPVDRFVADFIGESNFLDGEVAEVDGRSVLRMRGGAVLPAPAEGRGEAGGQRTLVIRPESVAVGDMLPEDPERFAALPGRVANVAFMGNHTRTTVRTDAGTLVAVSFSESDDRSSKEGMIDRDVFVWWDPSRSTLVASGDEWGEPNSSGGGGPTE